MKRTLVAVVPFMLLLAFPDAAKPQQLNSPKAGQVGAQKGAAASAPSAEDASLRQRVEQLEEQLLDLQIVIGTLESMAQPSGGQGTADAARMQGVKTQILALTAQMEALTQQVRSLGGQAQVGEAAPLPHRPERQATTLAPKPPEVSSPPSTAAQFGSTTVTAASADPIGGLIAANSEITQRQELAAIAPAPSGSAGLPSAIGSEHSNVNPKQLYETAYGYLLQQDYGQAEVAFDDFMRRFPGDSLAGNAQYWLGESFFVRGQYKQAASAFLKGYQTYAKSSKGPDSLLKLAMSLGRLGQKDAACSSYSELNTQFPTAPPHIKNRAQTERQRLGCA